MCRVILGTNRRRARMTRMALGGTAARRERLRATGGRYVMLLNDDTVAEPDSLRKLIAFMDDHPRCGAV